MAGPKSAATKVSELDLAQLKNVAGHLKIKFHPEAIEPDLIRLINQQPVASINAALVKSNEPAERPLESNSREQVEQVIAKFMEKEGYQVKFDEEENTVTFAYKGISECCNMGIPLRIIKQKAENVSFGRRVMRGLPGGDGVGRGYSDAILMG